MQKYFCEYLRKVTEGLKMSYVCKKTNKICPMVKYGYNAEAIPNIYFTITGCELLKKKNIDKENNVQKEEKEKIVEVKKEEKNEITIEQPKQSIEKKETTKKQYNKRKKSKK